MRHKPLGIATSKCFQIMTPTDSMLTAHLVSSYSDCGAVVYIMPRKQQSGKNDNLDYNIPRADVNKHIMMASSNGNIFRVTCPFAGISPVNGEFPSQGPVTRSFDVFFDLRLNKMLSKQLRRRWFETPPRSLWRHCNIRLWGELYITIQLLIMKKNIFSHFCKAFLCGSPLTTGD